MLGEIQRYGDPSVDKGEATAADNGKKLGCNIRNYESVVVELI